MPRTNIILVGSVNSTTSDSSKELHLTCILQPFYPIPLFFLYQEDKEEKKTKKERKSQLREEGELRFDLAAQKTSGPRDETSGYEQRLQTLKLTTKGKELPCDQAWEPRRKGPEMGILNLVHAIESNPIPSSGLPVKLGGKVRSHRCPHILSRVSIALFGKMLVEKARVRRLKMCMFNGPKSYHYWGCSYFAFFGRASLSFGVCGARL